MAGITALEVGGEDEPAFALGFAEFRRDSAIFKRAWMALAAPSLDVDDADCDAVFLLAFQHNGLRRADAELFAVVGWRDALVDGLVQYVDELLVLIHDLPDSVCDLFFLPTTTSASSMTLSFSVTVSSRPSA